MGCELAKGFTTEFKFSWHKDVSLRDDAEYNLEDGTQHRGCCFYAGRHEGDYVLRPSGKGKFTTKNGDVWNGVWHGGKINKEIFRIENPSKGMVITYEKALEKNFKMTVKIRKEDYKEIDINHLINCFKNPQGVEEGQQYYDLVLEGEAEYVVKGNDKGNVEYAVKENDKGNVEYAVKENDKGNVEYVVKENDKDEKLHFKVKKAEISIFQVLRIVGQTRNNLPEGEFIVYDVKNLKKYATEFIDGIQIGDLLEINTKRKVNEKLPLDKKMKKMTLGC